MKRIVLLSLLVLAIAGSINAQDIKVTRFERNYTSLIASVDPVYDNSGEACAVIRFFGVDNDYEIDPNLGYLRVEKRMGEVRMWLPAGTKRLTIRHQDAMTLSGFEIPLSLEPKVTYEADLEIEEKQKSDFWHHVFVQAGYNIMSISGPTIAIGANINNHIIELGGIYGVNKTDELYFYNTDGSTKAAYRYQAFRVSLRYGYEIQATKGFSIAPQVGLAYNIITGNALSSNPPGNNYKNANSFSALVDVKLAVDLSKHIKLYVTPEYDFGISKNDVCKLVSDYDKTFKSWTDGFNLSVGLMVNF